MGGCRVAVSAYGAHCDVPAYGIGNSAGVGVRCIHRAADHQHLGDAMVCLPALSRGYTDVRQAVDHSGTAPLAAIQLREQVGASAGQRATALLLEFHICSGAPRLDFETWDWISAAADETGEVSPRTCELASSAKRTLTCEGNQKERFSL